MINIGIFQVPWLAFHTKFIFTFERFTLGNWGFLIKTCVSLGMDRMTFYNQLRYRNCQNQFYSYDWFCWRIFWSFFGFYDRITLDDHFHNVLELVLKMYLPNRFYFNSIYWKRFTDFFIHENKFDSHIQIPTVIPVGSLKFLNLTAAAKSSNNSKNRVCIM